MPLSGVFFESLHHQSNRMTMFKKTDPNPQLDIFTAPSMQLGSRASKKYSDPNLWHNQFYSLVITKIDEEIYNPQNEMLAFCKTKCSIRKTKRIFSIIPS